MKNINFESSFIQAWYAKDFSKKRWIDEFSMLKEKNINEIILQSVFDTLNKVCFYETNNIEFKKNSVDMIKNCLDAAKETNSKVRIGLGESKLWWILGPLSRRWILKEAYTNNILFNEIFEKYGDNKVISGWYIPYELSDYFIATKTQRKNINKFLKEISENISAPFIYFAKDGSAYFNTIKDLNCAGIGVDWKISLKEANERLGNKFTLQGNLDPAILFSNKASIKKYAEKAIEDGKLCPGHIFNLGHGIMPATPVENVKYLIDVVKGLA